jgi:GNAT superfamily N-acetyltransferase
MKPGWLITARAKPAQRMIYILMERSYRGHGVSQKLLLPVIEHAHDVVHVSPSS